MNPQLENLQNTTRRQFLKQAGSFSLGSIALSSLLSKDAQGSLAAPINPLSPRKPQFPAKVKRVIYLHMSGGPPHLDIFDYKPQLVKHNGELCPDEFIKGRTFAFTSGTPKLMGTPRTFTQHGDGGTWMSDPSPNFQKIANDLCVIKSMQTEQFNNAPAELLLYT